MISANAYHKTCKLKKAQVFTIFIKDLKYQAEKKATLETNSKKIVLEKYYDFWIYLLKNTQIHSSYIKNIIVKLW